MSRRGVMRTTAVGIGAAAGVGALGSSAAPVAAVDWKDVGTIAATSVIGGPIALGWALRETGILGSDAPPEGLTADTLKQQVYQTARTRKSTNASTIVDNQNILDGIENTAYTDAKIAAIEEINAGSSESAVLDAATAAIDSYETTVRKNLLKTWNEAVSEFRAIASTVSSHPDLLKTDVFIAAGSDADNIPNGNISFPETSADYTFSNGESFTIKQLNVSVTDYSQYSRVVDPINYDAKSVDDYDGVFIRKGSETVSYLQYPVWNGIWTQMDTTFQNVRDGISTWVTNVYGQVQSGEVEISNLITPSVRAEMLSDEETEASAIADLAALNIPIDPEREATITITETSATLSGTIGLTDTSDGPIESGTTYDPSTFAGDVYFTADVSQLSGSWSAFNSGVDGGTITLTSQPYEGTVLNVTTTAGETVSVPATSWTDNGDGTWSYDASGELNTTITEVDSVSYESADDQTQYETLQISKQFTVDKIENKETGEEVTSTSFESSEPQTDSNYITQEEWNQLEQQNQELIEKYEESQTTSGGAGGFLGDGLFQDTKTLGIVAGGAALAALLFGNN